MNHHVSAETGGGDHHGSEGVVHDHGQPLGVSHAAEFGNVCHLQDGIGHGLEVEDFGLAFHNGVLHALQIVNVHEGGGDVGCPGEEMREQGVGTAVERVGGHHVSAGAAELEEDGGDGGHAAGGAVGGLGAFHGGHEAAQVQHCGVEVAAVDEEVAVGTQLAGEHSAEGLWLHDRERGGGLDGHVDAAVLPELVTREGQCGGGVHVACRVLPLGIAVRNAVVGAAALPVDECVFGHDARKRREREREIGLRERDWFERKRLEKGYESPLYLCLPGISSVPFHCIRCTWT